MTRPLLITNPENATIEELKQVCRVGSNETATRCTASQNAFGRCRHRPCLQCVVVTKRALRKWLSGLPTNPALKAIPVPGNVGTIGAEKLLERLDQAILDVIDNPKKTQKTTAIGTLS